MSAVLPTVHPPQHGTPIYTNIGDERSLADSIMYRGRCGGEALNMSRFVHTDTNGLVHLTFLTSDSDSDTQRNAVLL